MIESKARIGARPWRNLFRRRVRAYADVAWLADAVDVVEIGSFESVDPPIFPVGELERVEGGVPGTVCLDCELRRARETFVHHPAVRRLHFRDAVVHPGGIEARRGALRFGRSVLGRSWVGVERLSAAVHLGGPEAGTVRILDAAATSLLAGEREGARIGTVAESGEAALAARLGLAAALRAPFLRADHLTVYEDTGFGPSKRQRLSALRRSLKAGLPRGAEAPRRARLFLHHPRAARLERPDRLLASLAGRGFEVVDLERTPLEQVLVRLRTAEVVVGVEGRHLDPAHLAMPEGAAMVGLLPGDRFSLERLGYARASGLRFGFTVIEPSAGEYRVALDRLDEVLAGLRPVPDRPRAPVELRAP